MRKSLLLAGTAACHLLSAGTALAQAPATSPQADTAQASGSADDSASNSGDGGLQDIVVTAQRRSENLQRVPISIAVATEEQLQASGVSGLQSLKVLTPGVEVQSNNGYAFPIIRGVGSKATGPGIETPVAFYVDGVYYAAPAATLLSFNNIQQIEVLKGPQGTLFGRNATGGLIQVKTRDPSSDFGGKMNLSYGNYQTLKGDFYITGGLADNLTTDLAFVGTTMGDGYGTNLTSGKDVYRINHDIGIRSKTLLTIGSDTEVRLVLDYGDSRNSLLATRVPLGETIPAPYGPVYGGRPWDVSVNYEPVNVVKSGGASLRIDHDAGAVKIASITAYRKSKFIIDVDLDYTPTNGRRLSVDQRDHQFSQELQLLSAGNGPFSWVVGAFYFDALADYAQNRVLLNGPAAVPTVPPIVESNQTAFQSTKSISGFGQATLEVAPGLKLTGGLRYTSEKRELGNAQTIVTRSDGSTVVTFPLSSRSATFNKLTWRAAVDYQATPDVLTYLSYNRGFKSGGFNPSALTVPPFEPEVLDAFEGGIKSTLFDRRIKLNGAIYYYDYANTQLQRVAANGTTGIYNSAGAEIYGFDGELRAQVTPELNLVVGYQYAHGKYRSFPGAIIAAPRAAGGYTLTTGDAAGNVTILTPKHTVSIVANYTIPTKTGEISLNASGYYNSGFFVEPDNVVTQPRYFMVNASVRWEFGSGQSISIWGNNLTNRVVSNIDGINNVGFGVRRANYAPPRTYGVSVGTTF